jgi:apolipoprotein N-acyltransferase
MRVAAALAVLSGLLYFLGVPGVNLWPVAFVTWVPLLLALRGRAPRSAAALGLLSGFVASLLGFYWLYGMLRVFSGMPAPVCVVLMVATCAYQGGRTAATCWATAKATANGWPAAPAFVAASIAGELLYPLLFPWYSVFMMHRTPLLMQTADLGGVYLAGALLLGPNLALAEVIRAVRERVRPERALVAAGVLAPVFGAAYGAAQIKRVDAMAAASEPVTVGIAQGNLPLRQRTHGLEINRRLTEALRERGAGFVIWSEGSVPNVFEEGRYADAEYGRITRGLEVPVLFGAGTRRKVNGRLRELNSAFLADIDGWIVGRYDKYYLLPFGEFIPFGETFPSLYDRSPNSGRMIPGESVAPLVIAGHRITVLICYEDILPWFVNRAVREGNPEILVNVTSDTWFGRTIEPWEHLALAELRSIEHRRYLVRATNSGVSAIIDPVGRVTVHGGLFDEEALVGEVRLMTPSTVYEAIGDLPWYAVALALLGMVMAQRPRRQA